MKTSSTSNDHKKEEEEGQKQSSRVSTSTKQACKQWLLQRLLVLQQQQNPHQQLHSQQLLQCIVLGKGVVWQQNPQVRPPREDYLAIPMARLHKGLSIRQQWMERRMRTSRP